MRNLAQELDRDQEFPVAWKPREGDQIIGTIERYSTGTSSLTGDPVNICWIQTEDGDRYSIWLNNAVLISKFKDKQPKPGETIGVRYLGKHPTKNYKMFRLVVDREQQHPAELPADLEAQPVPRDALDDDLPAEHDEMEVHDDDVPF
jgi:hypothetical protein